MTTRPRWRNDQRQDNPAQAGTSDRALLAAGQRVVVMAASFDAPAPVEAHMETFDCIEAYYNRVRRHSALGYVSPAEFERAYFQRTKDDLLTNQEKT